MNRKANPNILFLVIDALRYDFFQKYITSYDTLNMIYDESYKFKRAYCSINTTNPSITSIFTGCIPRNHGILHHGSKYKKDEVKNFFKKNKQCLPEILQKQGYKTYAIDWLERWHTRGFDYYMSRDRNQHLSYVINKVNNFINRNLPYKIKQALSNTFYTTFSDTSSRFLTNEAIKLLKKHKKDKPFFTFIHYWDTHTPYSSPQLFMNLQKRKIKKKLATLLIIKLNLRDGKNISRNRRVNSNT